MGQLCFHMGNGREVMVGTRVACTLPSVFEGCPLAFYITCVLALLSFCLVFKPDLRTVQTCRSFIHSLPHSFFSNIVTL